MRYRYSDQELAEAVAGSHSYRNVMRLLGIKLAGGSQSHIKRRIERAGLDTSHFTGQAHSRGKVLGFKRKAKEILVQRDPGLGREKAHALCRALIEIGRPYRCAQCDNDGMWLDQPLTLHVDHIDGDWTNNEACNLRFLCPNCHHQTATFGRKIRAVVPELVAGD